MGQILLLLAFMTLCRIKSVEKLKEYSPGEFGKLVGLDRIPEVRCLRKKMDELCARKGAENWGAHLSRYWMNQEPDSVGTLYIDGHVHVYHGSLTRLPRRYVSRERLCLRGISDYWVNDSTGRPFFMVEKTVDPGLLKTLEFDILPRLLEDIPYQPTEKELDENPYICRFILVFDREGYSPDFFKRMWNDHRVACMTYHKHPGENWSEKDFQEHKVTMGNGEVVKMKLAEQGTLAGSGKKKCWVREIRKLTKSGHQTSIISTAYELSNGDLAVSMFSRWTQENFFRYMMQHFAIDALQEYGIEDISETEEVVNPDWRSLDSQRQSLNNKLRYRNAKFGNLILKSESENNDKQYSKWIKEKAELLEDIEKLKRELEKVKTDIKNVPRKIKISELDEKDKFQRLLPDKKRLMDTIKMIAYRAETSMAKLMVDDTVDMSKARSLLQALYKTEADIVPDYEKKRLRIRVHNCYQPSANKNIKKLLDKINKVETKYPGTELYLFYELR